MLRRKIDIKTSAERIILSKMAYEVIMSARAQLGSQLVSSRDSRNKIHWILLQF